MAHHRRVAVTSDVISHLFGVTSIEIVVWLFLIQILFFLYALASSAAGYIKLGMSGCLFFIIEQVNGYIFRMFFLR